MTTPPRPLRLAALLTLAILTFADLVAAPAAKALPAPITYAGEGCTGARAAFAVPIERARPLVPAPYRVYDYGGTGVALGRVDVTRCDRLRVGRGPALPGAFSVVSIQVDPPRAAPGAGSHSYDLWLVTTRDDLRRQLAAFGLAGDTHAGVNVSQLLPAPIHSLEGGVTWPRCAYSIEVAAPDPTAGLPTKSGEAGWHRGPGGTFRTMSAVTDVSHVGAAVLSADGRCDLGRMLLAAAEPAAGFVRSYSFTATVEAVAVT